MGNVMSDMGSLEYDNGWKSTWGTDLYHPEGIYEPYYTAANAQPMIRRIGSRVFLTGYLKLVSNDDTCMPDLDSTNSFLLAEIADSQFYLKVTIRSVNQCSHFGKACIAVDNTGSIIISRIYCRTWADDGKLVLDTNSFVCLDMSWFID